MIRRRTRATRTAVERHYFLVAASFGVLDDRSPNVFIFHLKLPRVREGLFRLRRGEIIGRCRPSAVEPKWKEEAAQATNATVPRSPSLLLPLKKPETFVFLFVLLFLSGRADRPSRLRLPHPQVGGSPTFLSTDRPTDRPRHSRLMLKRVT